jgi:hypothetical protein
MLLDACLRNDLHTQPLGIGRPIPCSSVLTLSPYRSPSFPEITADPLGFAVFSIERIPGAFTIICTCSLCGGTRRVLGFLSMGSTANAFLQTVNARLQGITSFRVFFEATPYHNPLIHPHPLRYAP